MRVPDACSLVATDREHAGTFRIKACGTDLMIVDQLFWWNRSFHAGNQRREIFASRHYLRTFRTEIGVQHSVFVLDRPPDRLPCGSVPGPSTPFGALIVCRGGKEELATQVEPRNRDGSFVPEKEFEPACRQIKDPGQFFRERHHFLSRKR